MSGSPKAASRHRSGADTPKKGNRSVASHHSNNNNSSSKSPHAGGAATGSAKEVALSHVPVHSLSHLQDLLRPLAGPRIATVARALNMDGEAAAATAAGTGGGGSSLRSASAAASGVDSGSAPATPLPPPVSNDDHTTAIAPGVNPHQQQQHGAGGKASHASAATSSVGVSTTAATAAEGAAVQATVPSLGLLLASATQLGGLLAQWRSYTAMARRDAAAASAAAAGGGGGRPPQAPSPTAGSHSAKATQGEPKVVAPPPSAERVLELLQVVLWYALATTEGARLAAGGRSHGTSGRATPALPGTAAAMAAAAAAAGGGGAVQHLSDGGAASLSLSSAARGRGGRGGSVGRAGSVARSGSVTSSGVSADPVGATDWLGSRMAAPSTATTAGGGTSSTAAAAVVMSDDQLAEHLFRPAVDAVVLLQDRASVSLLLPHSSGGEAGADTAATSPSGHHGKKQKRGGPAAAATAEGGDTTAAASAGADEMNLGVELQAVALWTLAALLVRFADSPFNASVFLPVLFPQVDVRGAKGASARHPILQPLLRGDAAHESAAQSPHGKRAKSTSDGGAAAVGVSLRCGAATALTALLHKLQPTLLYAEEPHPNRQAFISLATQCGTMLLSLHESLCWALSDANGSTAASAAAAPLLSTYASVVGVTPYNRCPRSRAAVLQTLHLPVIRTYLANDACAEYVPTTVLVANVFKNESMRGAAAQLLATTASDTTTITTAAAATTATTASAAPVVDQAGAGATTPKAEKAGKKSASASGDSFLSALLSHADTRLEVWRCMVPLSRLYPRMVHSEFYALMAASVRVVAALTAWEAAEEAAETAALEATAPAAAEGEGGEEGGGDDDGACTPRGQHLPAASSAAVSLTTSPKRSPQPDGAGHHDPHNPRSPSASAKKSAAKASGRSRARPGPAAPPEAFAECLRTWLHFMGYVWKAFDDNACDPALSAEGQQDRATLTQKQRIHMDLLRPAMRLRRCGEEVRTMTLRCIAQIGDDYLGTLSEPALGQELVQYVQVCIADPQPRVRGEALTTLGMWLWQYPSMDAFACVAIDNAVHSIMVDPNPLVRTKAAFALSNVTSRLPDQTCPTVRDSPEYMATLCATAMHAAVIDTESGVQGHGIRMMNHLLQVLSFDELISEVEEFEEGVAEGFLRVLLECLRAATRNNNSNNNNSSIHSMQQSYANSSMTGGGGWYAAPREAKHRWNAACALGMGLAREEVFEAEPKYAVEAVEALCTAVVRDHIFKVRTQAAGALGRVPGDCLGGAFSTEDLTPRVVRSLCEALESATATENFRQYKEQGTLHGALRAALGVMITTAKPSIELDKVFANYQKLLQKEQLL